LLGEKGIFNREEFLEMVRGREQMDEERNEVPRMKSLSVRLGVIILVISLSIFSYAEVWVTDWKHYGTDEEGSYSYDTESIDQLSKNIVRVWVQSAYTEKGISHWVEGGGKEFQDLDFSLIRSEFNCKERSIRYLRIVFYSKNGEKYYPINNDEWHFFAPDSMIGTLSKELCN
jgi:hypothetical protein